MRRVDRLSVPAPDALVGPKSRGLKELEKAKKFFNAQEVVNRLGMLTPWRCGRKLGLIGDSSCIRTKTA